MTSNKWILATKRQSAATNQSYGQTLQDKQHRIAYYRTEASKNPAVYWGGTLLPLHHPAMTPCLPLRDRSTRTPQVEQAYKIAEAQNQENHIRYLKGLRNLKKK